MMRRLILAYTILIVLPGVSRAATNCEQQFSLLGIVHNNQGNDVAWISEEVFGECMWTRIIKIELLEESVKVAIDKNYRSWKAIREDMGQAIDGAFTEFTKQDNFWRYRKRLYVVTIPVTDTGVYNEYKRNFYDPQIWNEKYGSDYITVPKFSNMNTSLVYYYPRGLYFNYTINQVYMLPRGFVLVFTKQPLLASGLDTMHGFIILKWMSQGKQ